MVYLRSGTITGNDFSSLHIYSTFPTIPPGNNYECRSSWSMRVWRCSVSNSAQQTFWPCYLGWVAFVGDSFGGEGNTASDAADDAILKLKVRLEFLIRSGRGLEYGMYVKSGVLHRESMTLNSQYYFESLVQKEEPGVSLIDAEDYLILADMVEGKVKQIGWCIEKEQNEWHVWREPILTSFE